jgi:hypothetical protein
VGAVRAGLPARRGHPEPPASGAGRRLPLYLISANVLATVLREWGQYEGARQLAEDTLTRQRRVLGDNHPDTLRSARNLAIALANLSEHDQARLEE